MAVEYPDGWGVWAIHGVRVTEQIVMRPETLTIEQIDGEQNAEVRRVMIERFGAERYLRESNATLVNEDEFGKLWCKEVKDDEPLVMVELLNSTPEPDGTVKTYFLRVPPDMPDCHTAVAWTFGLTKRDYAPLMQS